jgi:hypothetical protein
MQASDFVFKTASTIAQLEREYDKYGDHYTNPVTVADLKMLLRHRSVFEKDIQDLDYHHHHHRHADKVNHDVTSVMPWQRSPMLEEYLPFLLECDTFTFFWRCIVYVVDSIERPYMGGTLKHPTEKKTSDKDGAAYSEMHHISQLIRLYSGLVVDRLDETVTHVVLSSEMKLASVCCVRYCTYSTYLNRRVTHIGETRLHIYLYKYDHID